MRDIVAGIQEHTLWNHAVLISIQYFREHTCLLLTKGMDYDFEKLGSRDANA